MAEPWIDGIVARIKTTYTEAALEAQREGQRKGRIAQDAPIFWRDLGAFLQKFFTEIQQGLQGELVGTGFTCKMEERSYVISLSKADFPAVTLTARPHFASGDVELTLTPAAPPDVVGRQEASIPCRFEVQSDNTVALQLNGHTYPGPEAAARWLIERLFTIAG